MRRTLRPRLSLPWILKTPSLWIRFSWSDGERKEEEKEAEELMIVMSVERDLGGWD